MKSNRKIVIVSLFIMFAILSGCNGKIIDGDFTKVIIEFGREGSIYKTFTVTDVDVIKEIISAINSGERINLDEIEMEGMSDKDGRIIFINNSERLVFALFYDTGNLLSDKYLIQSGFDFLSLDPNYDKKIK
jgi:hypothetical protein